LPGSGASRSLLAHGPRFAPPPAGRIDPAAELLEVARAADADLVKVARRGTDFVARTLLGSVAARVVEHAHCDVVVVL
jgi:nucleotide-binding universal stress UspA family protein